MHHEKGDDRRRKPARQPPRTRLPALSHFKEPERRDRRHAGTRLDHPGRRCGTHPRAAQHREGRGNGGYLRTNEPGEKASNRPSPVWPPLDTPPNLPLESPRCSGTRVAIVLRIPSRSSFMIVLSIGSIPAGRKTLHHFFGRKFAEKAIRPVAEVSPAPDKLAIADPSP